MVYGHKYSEAEKIFLELQQQIIEGQLPPGHRLVEAQIASQFGVSRTPARLAIERLATVHQISFDELRELLTSARRTRDLPPAWPPVSVLPRMQMCCRIFSGR